MKTIRQRPEFLRNTDHNSAMLHLERNNKNLASLNTKLSAYSSEPKTRILFEQKEKLKIRLDNLRNTNQEFINNLKSHRQLLEDPKERIRKQREALKELEKSVLEYIGIARKLC